MRKYIILAPANLTSGGPELAHQLCHTITSFNMEAFMYYVSDDSIFPTNTQADEKYTKYNTAPITSFDEADTDDNVIIVPEGLAGFSFIFKKATVCLWWMSVDNYFPIANFSIEELANAVSLHLVQSQYARDFLLQNHIPQEQILPLSDYIGDIYKQFILPAFGRQDIILYNPRKGYDNIKPLLEKSTWAKWVPLANLSEEQMAIFMETSKIYIDFGNHPGKDRIPRETASCGCLVITNKAGSASFYEDVPIPDKYKFDEPYDYDQIDTFLHECCRNYENYFNDFKEYREIISKDKEVFIQETANFLNYFS